jgi:hypothetical protein
VNTHAAKDFFLRVFHPPPVSRGPVIESVQVQKPVHDVQFDLARQRITKLASVPSCGLHTDKNLALVKSYDVRRTTFAEKLEMQSRDAPIGNEPDSNSVQLAQVSSLAFLQLQTTLHSITCEFFHLGDVDRDFALKVANGDFWNCHFGRMLGGQNENNNQRCFASLNMMLFVTLAVCVRPGSCA